MWNIYNRANLDLDRMRQASIDLIGTHDFRSFCKLDITNEEPTFIRRIDNITIEQLNLEYSDGYQMCELMVHGSGFLWHQIRCIVAILLLIGQGKEEIDLIKSLLNIEKYPCTPNYQIASELPLVLFDCQFDSIEWIYDQSALRLTICHLQRHWSSFQIRATMIKSMLNNLENEIIDKEQLPILGQLSLIENDSNSLIGNNRRNYQPILTRPVRDSVKVKIEKYQNKKAKLGITNEDEKN
jgi:tRNA pseudouridine38/39 synthase